jgi:hypothetical protein
MSNHSSTVTITPNSGRPLRPLIEVAIQHEIDLLSAGIRRTEQRIRSFEQEHDMASDEFLRRYQNDELAENLDLIDWIGELRMLERLREKESMLRDVHLAD